MHKKSPIPTPTITPCRSIIPINSISDAIVDDNSPAQTRCIEAYQSLAGSIGWLANNIRLDITMVHSFLFSYTHMPYPDHTKAALYTMHYVHLMHNYGISSSSTRQQPIRTLSTSQMPRTLRPTPMHYHPIQAIPIPHCVNQCMMGLPR